MSNPVIEEALVRLGVARADETIALTPLAGGVSSDFWRVDLAGGPICVKRALPRLKVKPGNGHRQTQDLNIIDNVRDFETPNHKMAEHSIRPRAVRAD